MLKKFGILGIYLLPICIALAATLGCTPEQKVAGTYVADFRDSQPHNETTLELKDNGVGIWKVGDEEVSFTWHTKGGQVRVHTRGGGVLVGNLEDNLIRISLPGYKEMFFKKLK